jgi:hypothetical protein
MSGANVKAVTSIRCIDGTQIATEELLYQVSDEQVEAECQQKCYQ